MDTGIDVAQVGPVEYQAEAQHIPIDLPTFLGLLPASQHVGQLLMHCLKIYFTICL